SHPTNAPATSPTSSSRAVSSTTRPAARSASTTAPRTPLSASPPRTSTICSTPCSPPLPAESPRRAKDSAPGERRYGRPCHVQPLSWCVRELVATGWTQAAGARAADGREVDPWTDDAVAWSLLGAIVAALEEQARQAGGELQLGAQLTDDGVAAAWSRPRD